jgi:hypothetical protein
VIVHELLHLGVATHGRLFKALMNAYVPGWGQFGRRPQRSKPLPRQWRPSQEGTGAPCVAHAGSNTFEADLNELKAQCHYQNGMDGTARPPVDVERACQRRFKEVYAGTNETLHPVKETWWAYRLAVFEGGPR